MVVSSAYIRFWEDTAKALTVLVCGQTGGANMEKFTSECNPFKFDKDSRETAFKLKPKQISDIFQNEILFKALLDGLNNEVSKAWPERCLEAFCRLDETGRPLSPWMEAESIYFTACEEIIGSYSGMSGISLSYAALLAEMAYEKSDFESGTQLCFGARHPIAFSAELGPGSAGTEFDEQNLRTIRKLLSGVKGDKNALYFRRRDSGDGTYGYFCEGYVKKSTAAAFRVTFYGGGKWGFRPGNAKSDLLVMKNRQIQCFDAVFHFSLRQLRKEFRGCSRAFTSGGCLKFLKAARGQAHGTSVVIARFSEFPAVKERFDELERAGRGRSVNKASSKDRGFYRTVTDLARIDGALVADIGIKDCRFAYFAMILDGRVGSVGEGWTGFGARANSVLTFVLDLLRSELKRAALEELTNGVNSREKLIRRLRARRFPIAAVIFSEDGYVTPILGSELAAGLYEAAADGVLGKK